MDEKAKIIRQGSVDFSPKYKIQTTWGFQEALTFALEGMGATVFFVSFICGRPGGALLGLVILMASGALLLAHLGNPKNMIYVMANFRHSWMSRGAVMIPLFILLGLISVAVPWVDGAALDGATNWVLTAVFLLLTAFVLMKSGLVLSTFPAIQFWNGGMLPILFALNGLASGAALLALYPGGVPAGFFWVLPASLALLLVMLAVYILTVKETGRAAKVSVDLIGEEYFHSFFSAAVLLGTVLPLILGVYTVASPSAASFPVLFVIAALRIIGDVMTRNIILKVGVYDRVL